MDLATLELSIDENSSFSALQTLFHTDLYPEPARNFDAIEIDTTMVVLSRLERNVNFTYGHGLLEWEGSLGHRVLTEMGHEVLGYDQVSHERIQDYESYDLGQR